MSEEIVQASFHRERFKFRFLDLTESAVERLRKMLPDVNLKVHFRGTGAVVTFLVTEDLNCEALYSFLKQEALSPRKHSVWVSVVSSSDHDGVSLPEYVLGIIRRTMCGVDFAFVGCLGDPIEDEVSQGI